MNRGLWLWAGALALGLAVSVPHVGGVKAVAVGLVLLGAGAIWRYRQRGLGEEGSAVLEGLPAADFSQPLMVLCGDHQRSAPQRSAHAAYCPVPLANLASRVRQWLAQRPQWASQVSVLFVIDLTRRTDPAALTNDLRSLRHQMALLRQAGVRPPLLLLALLPGGEGRRPWFSWQTPGRAPTVHEAEGCSSLLQWQGQPAKAAERAARLATAVQLTELSSWWNAEVLPVLADAGRTDRACPPLACAARQVRAADARALWPRRMRHATGLRSPQGSGAAALALPDALLALLPRRPHPAWRSAVLAVWLGTAALALSMLGSAVQNQHLLTSINDALEHYQQLPVTLQHSTEGEQAMARLAAHYQQLGRWQRNGVPLGLGWGFYRAAPLRAPLHALLHGQPATLPAAPPATPIAALQLPSLALFDSGSAQLKARAHEVLVPALLALRDQPAGLIVIAGHTDATGDAARNRQLSQARAAAVRDWLQQVGGLDGRCFALQGLGASQPLASNDHEIGRATNRRVDIRLLPHAGGCAPAVEAAGIPPAPLSAALNASKE